MNRPFPININTAIGRKMVRELGRPQRAVEVENAIPLGEDGLPQKTYSSEFIEEYLWHKLDEHYGIDIRKL